LIGLAQMGTADRETVNELMRWLRKPASPAETALRIFVADALARAGPSATGQLLELLGGRNEETWPYAIRALGRSASPDPEVQLALVRFLEGRGRTNSPVRELAIDALGTLKAAVAVPVLVKILEEQGREGEHVREAAVIALGKIGDRRAVPAL